MKLLIIGGFLGSGKTTVVLQIARHLAEHSHSGRKNKVVIVENEIGEVGVDDLLLKSNGYTVSELFSGCACCTLAGELWENILQLKKDMNPEWILLETTGVAYPMNIKNSLDRIPDLSSRIITIIDASRFLRMFVPAGNLITAQLEGASVILITKTDLVNAAQLKEVTEKVREINDTAELFCINALEPIEDRIMESVSKE